MIRRRDQLLKWLIEVAQDDTLLRCTLENCLTRVELLGMFNPLLGSKNPGWLVRVTSSRGREELVGIVKNHLTLPDHFFFASGIDWSSWEGPSDDVMIGGDNNGQEKTSDTGSFHRIKQCTAVHTQKSSGAGDTTAGPGLDEKRIHPPVIPISHPPTIA